MPTAVRDRIKAQCESTSTVQGNPVHKRLVVVTGNDGVVHMEDVECKEQNGNQGNNDNPAVVTPPGTPDNNHGGDTAGRSSRQLPLSLVSSMTSLRQTATEQGNQIEGMRNNVCLLTCTNGSLVCKIDMNPLHQLQQAANRRGAVPEPKSPRTPGHQVDGSADPRAVLMPNPRDLHQLWREHTHGSGRNKPAKFFARAERGKVKFACSRRK